jgi:hypothetical protein
VPNSSIADILRRHSGRLLDLPGVVGTAQGTWQGRPCVLVLVSRRTAAMETAIPNELEGVPLRIAETGTPEAFERP